MQELTTVFLFTNKAGQWFVEWLFRLGIGVFVLAFAGSVLYKASKNSKSVEPKFVILAAFAILWGIPWSALSGLVFFGGSLTYTRLLMAYEFEYCQIVEGNIHVIRATTGKERAGSDVVKIGDVEFEIETFVMTFGYDKVIFFGGVLKEGVYAKVYYYDDVFPFFGSGRTILRIDLINSPQSGINYTSDVK